MLFEQQFYRIIYSGLATKPYSSFKVEIREEVGAENFFLFGLKADEVAQLKALGCTPL